MQRLIFITALFFCSQVMAGNICSGTKWPYSRSLSVPQIKLTLDEMSQNRIIQHLIYEIRKPTPNQMATPLLAYLIGKSPSSFDRGFFKTLAMVAFEKEVNILRDLEKWPKRRKIKKNRQRARESCNLLKKYMNSPERGKE